MEILNAFPPAGTPEPTVSIPFFSTSPTFGSDYTLSLPPAARREESHNTIDPGTPDEELA
ncbi:MAG: hypothetical protein AW09_001798 [Candidatus Accumulibacter phosphatis]|jgi:hypothetical protein|uniref:Uncharacterized protein n=1 Tax=Candidatus Accumulibacter phosphatis TaxID=327160 RepID=A0A080LWE1_9PROT|nr:MAG: hypothetical protein AW09_001798 [Candidatus Accumulibacter phosphatis]MBL8406655.1 hypothetical protein [Accumulibacter sp.]